MHPIEVVQEQSEILEYNYAENRKIIDNQFFDEDGNIFNSMLISFASGLSSIKGSPMNLDKNIPNQATNKNSPFCDLIVKTPIDKKKLFGNLKQTSSSLIRKAQAMNKPVHSNRKLFGDDEKTEKPKLKGVPQAWFQLTDKENNCDNAKYQGHISRSPMSVVKTGFNQTSTPIPIEKLRMGASPDTAFYKSPFVVHPKNINLKAQSNFGTPLNGLKGSLVAPSTWGSTQGNIANLKSTILMSTNDFKSRNMQLEGLDSDTQGYSGQKGTLKSIGLKSNKVSPSNSQYYAS